ncbi:MAG: hypothetical protein HZA51_12360 [Planctomycetes bacterium]|nr:hypothetical protein [Planctomycetota bacterium]
MNESVRQVFAGGVLPRLPLGVRALLTTFIVLIGCGYVIAFLNIQERHGMADGKPGLSLDDIRAVFGGYKKTAGAAASSRMLTMIRSEMRQYFSSDLDFAALESWLTTGAKQEAFDQGEGKRTPRKIIVRDCLRCHGQSTGTGIAKESPFGPDEFEVDYDKIALFAGSAPATGGERAAVPPQYTVPRLILFSHQHMLAIPIFTLLVGLAFSLIRFTPAWLKGLITPLPMLTLIFDFGGWWLARVSGLGAYFILAAGGVFGLAFGVQIVATVFDLWRPPGDQEKPR